MIFFCVCMWYIFINKPSVDSYQHSLQTHLLLVRLYKAILKTQIDSGVMIEQYSFSLGARNS